MQAMKVDPTETLAEVVPGIEKITGDANVQAQKVTGGNQVIFKTRTLSVEEREELVINTAVNMDRMIPSASVWAKPLTAPVCRFRGDGSAERRRKRRVKLLSGLHGQRLFHAVPVRQRQSAL